MSEQKKGTPKRGVSLYSYSGVLGVSMTMEDCFLDIQDTGASCIEILSGQIENYPHPTAQWVDNWWRLLDKYGLEPGGFGHWCDTNMYRDRSVTVDEAVDLLVRDFRLANLLGFKYMRTKLTVDDSGDREYGDPEDGWEEYVLRALDYAEKYDVVMCTEVHRPAILSKRQNQRYLEFIQKTGTRRFGFNIDFGTFQNQFPEVLLADGSKPVLSLGMEYSKPEEMIEFLPYTYYCHAKFNYMDENFEELSIPYREVLQTMIDHGWSSYLVSEYEGPQMDNYEFVADQIRRHHVMMKRILGY